jgi:hypothetical protein
MHLTRGAPAPRRSILLAVPRRGHFAKPFAICTIIRLHAPLPAQATPLTVGLYGSARLGISLASEVGITYCSRARWALYQEATVAGTNRFQEHECVGRWVSPPCLRPVVVW